MTERETYSAIGTTAGTRVHMLVLVLVGPGLAGGI